MTRIDEQAFAIDVPGQWERAESAQPGSLVYRESEGAASLTVMLLSVRPMFQIADQARVLKDYVDHRMKFERGQAPRLAQSEPVITAEKEPFEAAWGAEDASSGMRQRHRAILTQGVLADFCFESSEADTEAFERVASEALASIKMAV